MDKSKEEILNGIKNKYKIALFMVIRNSKVMPTGLKLGKSEEEINKMSYETMCELLMMIDYDKAREKYNQGKELSKKQYQEEKYEEN